VRNRDTMTFGNTTILGLKFKSFQDVVDELSSEINILSALNSSEKCIHTAIYLKYWQEINGLAQETLCYDTLTNSEIISDRQYRDYISAKRMPKYIILEKPLFNLGKTMIDYNLALIYNEVVMFDNMFEKIWDMFYFNKFKEAIIAIDVLKKESYYKFRKFDV